MIAPRKLIHFLFMLQLIFGYSTLKAQKYCTPQFSFMDVAKEHSYLYDCPKCMGRSSGCNFCGFDGGIPPKTPSSLKKWNTSFTPGYYLFLIQADIGDDQEHPARGTADIGLKVFGGSDFNTLYFNGRLFGPFNKGWGSGNSLKYEWSDCWSMQYNNFPLMKLDNYKFTDVIVIAKEGDEGWTKDDLVFEKRFNVSEHTNNSPTTFNFRGNCASQNKIECAIFHFAIIYCADRSCGNFWD